MKNVLRRVFWWLLAALLLGFFVIWPVYNTGVLLIRDEHVRIRSGDAVLAAKISIPRWGKGPFPAIVQVHGSGEVRGSEFRSDRRRLVPEGIVMLAYDKRGVGESTGVFAEATLAGSAQRFELLADDAIACLRAVKQRPDVDPRRAGFVGMSQAGWIIPLAMDRAPGEAAFAVILSGPATSVGVENYYSLLTGDGHRRVRPLSAAEIDRKVAAYQGPSGFDPRPVLERLTTPTLWIVGERDLVMPPRQTIEELQRLQRAGRPIVLRTYPRAGHDLADPADGWSIPYWCDPFWDDVFAWLRAHHLVG